MILLYNSGVIFFAQTVNTASDTTEHTESGRNSFSVIECCTAAIILTLSRMFIKNSNLGVIMEI